ncbi:ComF family protein [Georgenia halophila]|uniref:ComF family protein n=1 Tax=Georgenia halophila TaxID=620889 RepID=A0ABP8L0M6_9MICO
MDVRQALTDAGRLVLPVECAGCGRWDLVLCARCVRLLSRPPVRCEQRAPLLGGAGTSPLPTWSVGQYRGSLRAIVLAWKTGRRQDIAPEVLTAAEQAATTWAHDPDLRSLLTDHDSVLVVPVPSGWRRRVARRLVVADLADAVARGLAAGRHEGEVLVADVLRRRGGSAHQAGIGARARIANRRGTVRARARLPTGTAVVLVDDVVTTGASLAASADAAEAAGGRTVAAFTLASTAGPTGAAGRLAS